MNLLELPAFQHYRFLSESHSNCDLTFSQYLRLKRHKAWLACVDGTFNRSDGLAQVVSAWSEFADSCIQETCEHVAGQLNFYSDYAVLALGKLGSKELNLSSDVDLIFATEDSSSVATKFFREVVRLLSERTELGFCFRVDIDLRPGGTQGPMFNNLAQIEDYYGNFGEAWERMAFVRCRAVHGSSSYIDSLLHILRRFTYRKHLDYSLLEDFKITRAKVLALPDAKPTSTSLNIKLSPGGIREVELFIHSLMVIHGGKNSAIRTTSTESAIMNLVDIEVISVVDGDFLRGHYWKLRRLENAIQAKEDSQTHQLLKEDFSILTHFELSWDSLMEDMKTAHRLVGTLLGTNVQLESPIPETLQEQIKWLEHHGVNWNSVEDLWTELFKTPFFSRNRERDHHFRQRFLTEQIRLMLRVPHGLNIGLPRLLSLLRAIKSKPGFYYSFAQQERLHNQLSQIILSSETLANLIVHRPELLDSFFFNQVEIQSEDPEELAAQLLDYKLINTIHSSLDFIKDPSSAKLEVLSSNLSKTADFIAGTLLRFANSEFNTKLNILCLGKWACKELGIKSDLDFIFITEEPPSVADLKAARRFLQLLTGLQRGGVLYATDLRLKPTESASPLVAEYAAVLDFLSTKAAPWEIEAYSKGRFLHPYPGLDSSEPPFFKAIKSRHLSPIDMESLKEIQFKLYQKKTANLDEMIKYSRGGLLEIELAAQCASWQSLLFPPHPTLQTTIEGLALAQSQVPRQKSWFKLLENYYLLRVSEQLVLLGLLPTCDVKNLLAQNDALLQQLDPRRGSN